MKYRVVLFNSFGDDKVLHYNSWLGAKLMMLWLNLTGKDAVWLERGE